MRTTIGVILALLLNLSSNAWADTSTTNSNLQPSADITPDQVIKIVVEALRCNDPETGDEGIATVWRFAAPSNKAITGPLERFSNMLRGGFSNMLNHSNAEFGPIEIDGDRATQPVWLVTPQGNEFGYVFTIRRQGVGEYEGAWMTESVYPVGTRDRGTTI